MGRKNSITLSLESHQKAALEDLALQFGCLWGDSPNISALLKAIADGDIKLSREETVSLSQRKINQKRTILEIQQLLLELEKEI